MNTEKVVKACTPEWPECWAGIPKSVGGDYYF